MKTSSLSLFSIPFLFAYLSSASVDCSLIRVDKKSYDFSKLDAIHRVWSIDRTQPPAIYNTTWTVSLCKPLKVEKSKEKDQCPHGTNICGIRRSYNPVDDPDHEQDELENVFPIAGSYTHDTGKSSEPKFTKLKKTQDSNVEGLQLDIRGGVFGKRNQKAIVNFICDPKRSGKSEKSDDDKSRRAEDDDDDAEKTNGGDITFKSYETETDEDGKLFDILRLDWRTKYSCDEYEKDKPSASEGWGFFTWFILILFLGIAAYLVFGSWLNYNRYGARGWDLLPHGDTIRDIPYLVKDWGKKVVDTVSGPGSRGGYSAV